ncbi:MAG: outer membrane protein assembly factor BamC [Leucothrix sp.]
MRILPALIAASLLTGCSSLARFTDVTNLVNYSDHKSVKVLEIPSDLDAPNFNKTYVTTISDSMAQTKSERLDRVPLVDKTMGPPPASTVKLVQQGTQVVMQIEEVESVVWKRVNDTLKAMGMTIGQSDQASGLIVARDRSLVSDPGSPIGRFLNKSLGKMNKGAKYQFRVTGSGKLTTIAVLNGSGKALPAADARQILGRLRKEYTS